jgi:methylthioribose-1-phosphate isomerase
MLGVAVEFQRGAYQDADALSAISVKDMRDKVHAMLECVQSARPTAVNVFRAVRDIQQAIAALDTAAAVKDQVVAYAERLFVQDVADNRAIGAHGARWLLQHVPKERPSVCFKVLTHCNTGSLATAGYGTALGMISFMNVLIE